MKKQILFLAFSFILKFSVGQNLVPNPGFENVTYCDSIIAGGYGYSSYVPPWDSPSLGSPDVFEACFT